MAPITSLAAFANDKALTIEAIAKLLASDQIRNVVVLAGAGISTSAGIPDFRSSESGLYSNLERYDLPYPEAIFEISYFLSNPQPFFHLAKELYPGNFSPTVTHYFLRLLDEKGKLLRVFTQNIDTLERLAGLSADRIVEAHGSFATSRCLRCRKQVDDQWIKELCMRGKVAYCPDEACKKRTADRKGGLVKPDIVFFGEGLPDRFFSQLSDLKKADLLIIMGTSLQVRPFASLIDRVRLTCPRLLINLERVGDFGAKDGHGGTFSFRGLSSMFGESGFDFDGLILGRKSKEKIRDVFYQGRCDNGVRLLARECGWEGDLEVLYQERHRFGKTAPADASNKMVSSEQKAKEAAAEAAAVTEKGSASGEDSITTEDETQAVADDLEHKLSIRSNSDGLGQVYKRVDQDGSRSSNDETKKPAL